MSPVLLAVRKLGDTGYRDPEPDPQRMRIPLREA